MSLTTTTAHGVVFGLDLTGWPDDTGRELAAMSLAAQLQALGVDQARELHRSLSRGGWRERPRLVRRIEALARTRGLSAYSAPVRAACSVGVFPATDIEPAEPVTLH